MSRDEPRVLVLTTTGDDAGVFRDLLAPEYPDLRVAIEIDQFAPAFERYRPHVLILAMREVAESERQYANLLRGGPSGIAEPHKTLLLCDKDDVRMAYDLCRADRFDDYILFWPMVHDAPRLSMSVHHSLRFLAASRSAALLPDLHLQARRIAELEEALERERSIGSLHSLRAAEALEAVGTGIRTALDHLGRRMIDDGLDESIVVRDITRVLNELERFDREFVKPPVVAALEAATPVREWIAALPDRLDSQLHAARDLGRQAATVRPLILVVDDDDFMRKLLLRLLRGGGYDAEAVESAVQAIAFLRARQPGLILMDVRLPDVDGIELTKQLKAIDAYTRIPVIMLTGQGHRQVLVDSREAGAADFIVKPFDRETLLKKVSIQLAMPVEP